MTDIYTLGDLREGEWGRVRRLDITGAVRRRLQDIGLIEGTRVRCLLKSPFGDPSAFLIRGAVIALRRDTSGKIII